MLGVDKGTQAGLRTEGWPSESRGPPIWASVRGVRRTCVHCGAQAVGLGFLCRVEPGLPAHPQRSPAVPSTRPEHAPQTGPQAHGRQRPALPVGRCVLRRGSAPVWGWVSLPPCLCCRPSQLPSWTPACRLVGFCSLRVLLEQHIPPRTRVHIFTSATAGCLFPNFQFDVL